MHLIVASEAAAFASETLFALALVVIAGPLLAEKARLPGLIGFMLGGMLLGPHMIGLLEEGQFDSFGALGILYLMFLAGLELDMDIFNRYRGAAVQFGLMTFVFPFGLGWLAAEWLGYETGAAVLLGSIWASHTLVSLPIVKRAGLSGSRTAAVAAGATILTDTLALVILALVTSSVSEGTGASALLLIVGGLVALVFVTLWLFPKLGRWFFSGPGTDRTLRVVFLIGAMALAGFLSELAGIEGIVGAFFAGLGLNRLVPKRSHLMEQVEFLGSAFFIPAFLVSVGMLINPAVLFDTDTLRLAAVFVLVVGAGKGLAALVGGRRFRFSWGEVGLLFSLTIGQAAATLAAALVGVSIGLLDEQILNAVVLTVLVTILGATLLTRFFAGAVEPDRTIMQPIGSQIVVPITPGADDAVLRLAGSIAQADTGTVTALLVIPPELAAAEPAEGSQERVDHAAEAASSAGAEAMGQVRVDGSNESAVLNVVTERGASMIVMATSPGASVAEMLFGSAAHSIGGNSPVPVVLATQVSEQHERIVVVIPGRPRTAGDRVDTQIAVDVLHRLATSFQGPVVALLSEGATLPELPKGATIERSSSLSRGELSGLAQAGDLFIAPLTSVRRFIGYSPRQLRLPSGVGLLITAGPYRLRTAGSTGGEVAETFGYVQST